jgi:hypothetical protein
VLGRAEVSEHRLCLSRHHEALNLFAEGSQLSSIGEQRSQTPSWLPELVLQSVCSVTLPLKLRSLDHRVEGHTRERRVSGRELVAAEWRNLLECGAVSSRAELARRMGVSRARVTQVLATR